MLDIRNQEIGNITNSAVFIANGDVRIDKVVYNDLKKTLVEIVKKDFEAFSLDAVEAAKLEIAEFLNKCYEGLAKEKLIPLVERFKKPSMQIGLHDSLIGYISSENDNTKEYIVDVMIDRLKVESNSTEQSLVDDAIKIVPHLNQSTLSLLALMTLRHQVAQPPISFMLDHYFRSLSTIIDNLPSISNLDIEYIEQNKCTKPIIGIYPIDTFENHLLKQYDLFFRKEGRKSELDQYALIHPEIMEPINEMNSCMFCGADGKIDYWKFCDTNSKLFYDRLRNRGQEYLIPLVEELKSRTPQMSVQEVRDYLCCLNPNWQIAINLLNSPKLTRTALTVLGLYIGNKVIAKHTNGKSISISKLTTPISL